MRWLTRVNASLVPWQLLGEDREARTHVVRGFIALNLLRVGAEGARQVALTHTGNILPCKSTEGSSSRETDLATVTQHHIHRLKEDYESLKFLDGSS